MYYQRHVLIRDPISVEAPNQTVALAAPQYEGRIDRDRMFGGVETLVCQRTLRHSGWADPETQGGTERVLLPGYEHVVYVRALI